MKDLVVGVRSGVGRAIYHRIQSPDTEVLGAGAEIFGYDPKDPTEASLFTMSQKIGRYITTLPEIKTLVYSLFYYREANLGDLRTPDINMMTAFQTLGLMHLVKGITDQQRGNSVLNDQPLRELIVVNAVSQGSRRIKDAVYQHGRGGAIAFCQALVEDGSIGRILVAEPDDRLNTMVPEVASAVAEQILQAREDDKKPSYVRIFDQPYRYEGARHE